MFRQLYLNQFTCLLPLMQHLYVCRDNWSPVWHPVVRSKKFETILQGRGT